jgi:hypothetical protein
MAPASPGCKPQPAGHVAEKLDGALRPFRRRVVAAEIVLASADLELVHVV